jgi:DNA-binding response OmpR family regulator
MFQTALEAAGFAVVTEPGGEAALASQRRRRADLILLDLKMPGLDGMDVLRRLRDDGDETPVVIVTAHGSVPDAVRAMKLGAIDFVSKPLSPYTLRAVVSEVLDRQASRPEPVGPTHPDEPVTAASQFAANLQRAKRALNGRAFDEAEVYLRQSIGLNPDSAEAHNLMGVLHELCNRHDASYREYKAALKADRRYEPAKHNMTRYYERFTFGSSDVPLDTGGP